MPNNTQKAQIQLLREPIAEFMFRISNPTNLSKTLNRLIFDALLQKHTLLPNELENLHALSDLLLSFQLLSQATILTAPEA